MKGKLIVIEGLDGSGKATQSRLLYEELQRRGMDPGKLSFPVYESESSGPVRMYLSGRFGAHPDDVDSYAASVLFAVDRFASYRSDWKKDYDEGRVFVCDRYTTSNCVFQTNKLPEEERDAYIEWLEDFEYRLMGIPAPDLVIFLNMSEETSNALMEARYGGDENKKDIHERDAAYQKKCRESAVYCARKLGWKTLDCDAGGVLLSREEIHGRVMALVDETLFSREVDHDTPRDV